MSLPYRVKKPDEVRLLSFNFAGKLTVGAALTGDPLLEELSETLEITDVAVSGSVVTCLVGGGTVDTKYKITSRVNVVTGELRELDVIVGAMDKNGPLKKYYQQPDEIVIRTFDFSGYLAPGATLTGAPVMIADAGLTIGSGSLATPLVSALVSGGALGGQYQITCRCAATNGEVIEEDAIIVIKEVN